MAHTVALRLGITGWSMRRPIGVVMLTLAVMGLGAFCLERLSIELLPHTIYPDACSGTEPGNAPEKCARCIKL